MSTVIPHRRAETFGIIELMLEEKIARSGGLTMENKVPILIVVGKGIPVDRYATRGLKAIYLKFQTDKEVTLDIDTHRFTGIDDNLLQKEGYYDLDFTQKGINSPLISAAHNSFKLEGFQYWSSASRNVSILYEGLQRAGSPRGYNQDRFCRDLESMLLREQGGFLQWDIPADLNRFIIGGPVNNSIA